MKIPIQSLPVLRKVSSVKIAAGASHNLQLSDIRLQQCLARCRNFSGPKEWACILGCRSLAESGGLPGR